MKPTPSPTLAATILIVQVLLTAGLGYLGARLPMDNSIDRFAPQSDREQSNHQIFTANFGQGQVFVVTAELDDPQAGGQAETLFRELGDLPGIASYDSPANSTPPLPDFNSAQLPLPLLQGPYYSAVFHLAKPPDAVMPAVTELLEERQANPSEGILLLNLAGEPVVNHYLNQGSAEVKARFFPLLILLSVCLLGLWFRSIPVLLVTGLSVGSSLAATTGLMALLGQKMNLITTLVPALVFVLAVAMQVHILPAIGAHDNIIAGLRAKFKPNLMVTLTTGLGFASLLTSRVAAVVDMGLFMVAGIVLIFVMTHLTHLGLSVVLGLRIKAPRPVALDLLCKNHFYLNHVNKPLLLIFPIGLIGVGANVLVNNPVQSNGLMYFKPNHPVRTATDFLQEHITGAAELEILIDRQQGLQPLTPAWRDMEAQLLQQPGVRHLISLNRVAEGFPNPALAVPLIERFKPQFIHRFQSDDYYRIQLLVNTMDARGYAPLKAGVQSVLANSEARYVLTGTQDRVITIQSYLLDSLIIGLLTTILAVVILLVLMFGGLHRIAVVLIPNLFPPAVMACFMWLTGIQTTIATIMVFSICFGIAVDDTIHLMHGYTSGDTSDFPSAWRRTLERDGRAIWMTTMVLSSGFLVLTTSSFIPTQSFGLLLAVGMCAALLGDLIFLPAALMLGRDQRDVTP